MKKIWFLLKFFEPKRCKIWNVMKWCVIFTVFLSFSVSAEIAAQQEKVNLNLSKANLQTLFQEIQRQTAWLFDVRLRGYCGKREGASLKLQAEYGF